MAIPVQIHSARAVPCRADSQFPVDSLGAKADNCRKIEYEQTG
jgi:hypothetical protein